MEPLYRQWCNRNDLTQDEKLDLMLELCGILVMEHFYQKMLNSTGEEASTNLTCMGQVVRRMENKRLHHLSKKFDKEDEEEEND